MSLVATCLLVQQCLHHMVGNLRTESPKAELSADAACVEEASCASPTLLGSSPTADPTDLVQAALIGLPLVFVGLGQRRVLCLQDGGRGQKGSCGIILPSGENSFQGRGGKESTNYTSAQLLVPAIGPRALRGQS